MIYINNSPHYPLIIRRQQKNLKQSHLFRSSPKSNSYPLFLLSSYLSLTFPPPIFAFDPGLMNNPPNHNSRHKINNIPSAPRSMIHATRAYPRFPLPLPLHHTIYWGKRSFYEGRHYITAREGKGGCHEGSQVDGIMDGGHGWMYRTSWGTREGDSLVSRGSSNEWGIWSLVGIDWK